MKVYSLKRFMYRLNQDNKLCLTDNLFGVKGSSSGYISNILRNKDVSEENIDNLFAQIGKGKSIARIWDIIDDESISLYSLTFEEENDLVPQNPAD